MKTAARGFALFLVLGLSVLFAADVSRGAPASKASATVTVKIPVDPLRVTFRLGTTTVRTGTRTPATAQIANSGRVTITGVSARVFPENALVAVPAGSQALGILRPGVARQATWTICPLVAGRYFLTVRAGGLIGSVPIVDYGIRTINAIGVARQRC